MSPSMFRDASKLTINWHGDIRPNARTPFQPSVLGKASGHKNLTKAHENAPRFVTASRKADVFALSPLALMAPEFVLFDRISELRTISCFRVFSCGFRVPLHRRNPQGEMTRWHTAKVVRDDCLSQRRKMRPSSGCDSASFQRRSCSAMQWAFVFRPKAWSRAFPTLKMPKHSTQQDAASTSALTGDQSHERFGLARSPLC